MLQGILNLVVYAFLILLNFILLFLPCPLSAIILIYLPFLLFKKVPCLRSLPLWVLVPLLCLIGTWIHAFLLGDGIISWSFYLGTTISASQFSDENPLSSYSKPGSLVIQIVQAPSEQQSKHSEGPPMSQSLVIDETLDSVTKSSQDPDRQSFIDSLASSKDADLVPGSRKHDITSHATPAVAASPNHYGLSITSLLFLFTFSC